MKLLFFLVFLMIFAGCTVNEETIFDNVTEQPDNDVPENDIADVPVDTSVDIPVNNSDEETDAEEPEIPENNTPLPYVIAEDGYKEFSVTAQRWYYTPDVIEVNSGDKVRIKVHNIGLIFGMRIGGISRGKNTLKFTAEEPGTFIWRCDEYCGSGYSNMTGRFIVK
ncbi:hypothetical protein C4573_05535 [Candidatus Woesearchaeota archaeon]|nr:MAG: hypothetical protein C4573_05535 [Candidatus Woesearchaeota archaeon]